MTDDEGRPLYESNARFVEWENGTMTLHVGSESFPLRKIPQRVVLFEENSQDVMLCHGVIKEKFIATPVTVDSSSHELLKKAQYRKYEPVRRSLVITPGEQSVYTKMQLAQEEQAKKQMIRDKKKAADDAKRPAPMTAAFLEDDAGA